MFYLSPLSNIVLELIEFVCQLRVLSNMYGYEFALAGTGSMILQDSGLAFLETSPRLQGVSNILL